ncbi:uncharacterized protein PHACADRAFT_249370 [Phanerochaete carnosa HHB-10118-sp]|uniref:Uncharacterized protein n=1 Tax=Phanerochaete carnosa (strain HHB-10118-sp) TaxID=650164 RepID=K5V8I6_PHACS|nr:uncharacterized protein PHACADRAFT_249370 [Phanerochaete carnosa HHB-10118-sp]EKM59131.1 hypothetical protein PHACADRAFT_249370 [Phanerochaete carnosa HHB-10118-sp]
MPPPQQPPSRINLSISTLVWHETPSKFYLDGEEPQEMGRYELESQPIKLRRPTWSNEMRCFVFAPKGDDYASEYGREKSAGRLGIFHAEHGTNGAWGQGSGVPPLLFLHRISNPRPYVATLRDKDFNEYEADQPPFGFLTCGEGNPSQSFRSGAPHLQLDMPDLGYRFDAWDSDSESLEQPLDEDGAMSYVGWSKPWTGEITYRVRAGSKEASMTWEKEIWDHEERWGVRLELEPDSRALNGKNTLGKDGLSSYAVRATLLEVYVKPDFIVSATF